MSTNYESGGQEFEISSGAPPIFSKAPVAQLDRAPDFESGGQGFESLPARQGLSTRLPCKKLVIFTVFARNCALDIGIAGDRIVVSNPSRSAIFCEKLLLSLLERPQNALN